jgi:serine/threonine-protein kinase
VEKTTDELLPETTLGQYEIRRWIGAGGMGDVYEAVHKTLNRVVAIKTLQRRFLDDSNTVARFLREGQLASRIRHPNVVDVTDVGMIGGMPCLVMELLEGEALSAAIKRGGALPVQTLVDLVLPIVAAVEAAHEVGLLHRDIKPANIFLARSHGEVVPKIVDFGISKMLQEQASQASLTADSAFVGTPHYASPEIMQGDRSIDGRSDQYSMGVVLYECATGAKPFAAKGDNFVSLALAACAGEFPPPRAIRPDVPPEFEAVILRAMALRRKERFTSMRALGEALLPFASERVRFIWSPTFAKPSARDAKALEETAETGIVPNLAQRGHASAPSNSLPTTRNQPLVSPSGPSLLPVPPSMPVVDGSVGGASMGRAPSPPRPPWLGIAIGGAVVAMFVVAIGAVAVVKYKRASSSAPSATVSGAPTSFEVAIAATPDAATFELDGVPAGRGSLTQTFPRDGRQHVLRVQAPGYETVLIELDESHPPPSRVALRPTTTPAATTSAPTPTGPVHGRPGSKGSDGRPRTDNIDPWQ